MSPEERAEARLIERLRKASRLVVPSVLHAKLHAEAAYALEAAVRERDDLRKASEHARALIETTLKPIEGMIETLKFYADRENWTYPYSDDMEPGDVCEKGALVDAGDRARAALKAAGVET